MAENSKQLPAPVLPAVPIVVDMKSHGPTIITPEIREFAEMAAASGYFKDVQKMAQGVMKIVYGQDYGMTPAESLNGLHIILGKVVIASDMMSDKIHQVPGLVVQIVELSITRCELALLYNNEDLGHADFTIEQAELLDITKSRDGNLKPMWLGDPESMLYARAIGRLYRRFAKPYLHIPSYTFEEMKFAAREEEDQETKNIFARAGRSRRKNLISPEAAEAAENAIKSLGEQITDAAEVKEDQCSNPQDQNSSTSPGKSTESPAATAGAPSTHSGKSTENAPKSASQTDQKSSQPPTPSLNTTKPAAGTVARATRAQMDQLLLVSGKKGWSPEQLVAWICKTFPPITPATLKTQFTDKQWLAAKNWVEKHGPNEKS